jgi:adenylosuccinate lyase
VGLREISPLDGRYASKVAELRDHVSEWALMRRRVQVEVEWLLVLAPQLEADPLRDLYRGFDDEAAAEIKQI